MKKSLGIYIHIPFCLRKCRYFDFCSFPDKGRDTVLKYADAICRNIKCAPKTKDEYTVDTVYFGGGTPSLMPKDGIEKILNSLREGFELSEDAEITMECNPATAELGYLSAVRAMGVNRLSIGLQSAVEGELKLLGRAHSLSDFVSCYNQAREAGFDNISVDLMYGIPDQTEDSLMESLNFIESIAPEHVSVYGLMIEKGTYFAAHEKELRLADDEGQAHMYLLISRELRRMGYEKYEISNFSLQGRESRHNMRYWHCLEYLGFGVAAHSYFKGERFGNSRDIDGYLQGIDITEERESVDGEGERAEYLMLGMRLSRGISRAEYARRFGRELDGDLPPMDGLIAEGFLLDDGDRISFTDKGFLVSNEIIARMLP